MITSFNPYFSPLHTHKPIIINFLDENRTDYVLNMDIETITTTFNKEPKYNITSVHDLPAPVIVVSNTTEKLRENDIIISINDKRDVTSITDMITRIKQGDNINIIRNNKEIIIPIESGTSTDIHTDVYESSFLITVKWNILNSVIAGHGRRTDIIKRLPSNINLMFYCKDGEIACTDPRKIDRLITTLCESSNYVERIEANTDYKDIELSNFSTEIPLKFFICGNNSRLFVSPIMLSQVIETLDTNFLWSLRVFACRSDRSDAKKRMVNTDSGLNCSKVFT